MSECVEGGTTLAWRLLATLEGGSLILAACSLLAYTARGRSKARVPQSCSTVAITDASSELGKAIKSRLEAHGCAVSVISGATSGTTSEATSGADKYDALVVVGARPCGEGLDGLSTLVSDDVYNNIKLLETLSARVKQGGYIVWASTGGDSLGAFDISAAAFDSVLHASLVHIAQLYQCEPIWIERCSDTKLAADRVTAALVTCDTPDNGYNIRNAVNAVGGFFYRWLKTIT